MWGPPWDAAWKRNDPLKQVSRIVANGTRLWIYCGTRRRAPRSTRVPTPTRRSTPTAWRGSPIKSNKDFQAAYMKAGGSNATFQFPAAGNHAWPYWGAQLQALKPDLIATLNG